MGDNVSSLNSSHQLDVIATKLILTSGFKNMTDLFDEEHCNQLVIITQKILENMSMDIQPRHCTNKYTTCNERVSYFSTQNMDPQEEKIYLKPKDIKDVVRQDREQKLTHIIQGMEYARPGLHNITKLGKHPNHNLDNIRMHPTTRRSHLFRWDVKNYKKKRSMCNSIARFYVSIAHLYAAIVRTVNPIYTWVDEKNITQTRGIEKRNEVPNPRYTDVSMRPSNICEARVKLLRPELNGPNIRINISKLCSMNTTNKKPPKTFEYNKASIPTPPTNEAIKVLTDEPGIVEFEKLFLDAFKQPRDDKMFNTMSPESKVDYTNSLEAFYNAFSGTDIPFDIWNVDHKKFSDIKLIDHSKSCNSNNKYIARYEGTLGLFEEYGIHIKTMLTNATINRDNILNILQHVFMITQNGGIEVVSIKPELTLEKIQTLIKKTRKLIVKLYTSCQDDFKKGLVMIDNISKQTLDDNKDRKQRTLQHALDITYDFPV
jgi:hypothetical protein